MSFTVVLLWFSLLASVTINSHRLFSHVLKFDGTRLINWNVTSEVDNLLLASHSILMDHF
ncbi:hypothetical protein Peur_001672 [Populus x canadensis]